MNPPRYVVQLMVDNHEDKLAFLKLICRHVANTRCFFSLKHRCSQMYNMSCSHPDVGLTQKN